MQESNNTVWASDATILDGGTTLLDGKAALGLSAAGVPICKGDTILETYRVESDAIEGGMGSVWRVHHTGWNVDLAMKRPQEKCFATEKSKADFIHECEAWINLGLHPNIVACYYVREIGGVPSIFSEWMDGGSLADAIEKGGLYAGNEAEQQERILDIAIQFARGLHYAHECQGENGEPKGLIHQDVKPGNLLLTKEGEAKVADFGLAKARAALTLLEGNPDTSADYTDSDKTRFSASGGYTPAYCSMEQMDGKKLTRRTDIYSWAVSVMEMYAGERPWANGVVAGLNCREYFGKTRVSIPEALKDLLASCLNMEEANRPHDFAVVEERLLAVYRAETGGEYPHPASKAAADTADSLNNRALSFLDLGKPAQAEACWERALSSEPSHLLCAYNQSLYLWRQGRMDDVSALYAVASREKNGKLASLFEGERSVQQTSRCGGDVLTNIMLNGLAISRDGRTAVLTDSHEHPQCKLLDTESMKCTVSLYSRMNKCYISSAVFTPDDRYVLTTGLDGLVIRWDVRSGKPVDAYAGEKNPYYPDERAEIFAVNTLPDGSGFVTADACGKLWVRSFGPEGGDRMIESDSDRLTDVHVSEDGRLVAAAGRKKVYIWEVDTGRPYRTLYGHDTLVTAVRLTGDGKTLVSGDYDGVIKVWSVGTAECLMTIKDHTERIQNVEIDRSGALMLSCSVNGAKLHRLKNGRCLRTYEEAAEYGDSVCARFSPDGLSVFTAVTSRGVARYTLPQGARAEFALAKISSSGQVSQAQKLFLERLGKAQEAYSAGEYALALELLKSARSIESYRNAPDCLALNFELSRHCTITGISNIVPFKALLVGENCHSAHMTNDENIFITQEYENFRYWKWDTGELLDETHLEDSALYGLAVSMDGSLAACGTMKGDICILDRGSRKTARLPEPYHKTYSEDDFRSGRIGALVFSPDGKWIYSSNDEGHIDSWSVVEKRWHRTLHMVEEKSGMGFGVEAKLELSPDGDALLIVVDDKMLIIDPASGTVRANFGGERFTSCYYQAKMDPKASFIITENDHKKFQLWDISTGYSFLTLDGADGRIAGFSADGRFAVIGSQFWDMKTMTSVYDLKETAENLAYACLSPRGDHVLTVQNRKRLLLWRVDYSLL